MNDNKHNSLTLTLLFIASMFFSINALAIDILNANPAISPWVNSSKKELTEGVSHKMFFSKVQNNYVGFQIYLPPSYNSSNNNYPVIYFCHGKGGNESSGDSQVVAPVVEKAIAQGILTETIVVFVNGGSFTMYSDPYQGDFYSESVIINELIPAIDENYRTRTDRAGRAMQGMSMGGFGALKFASKYPDMFGSIVTYGAAIHDVHSFSSKYPREYRQLFNGSETLFNQSSPYALFEKNFDKLNKKTPLTMFVGGLDNTVKEYNFNFWHHLWKLRFRGFKNIGVHGVRHVLPEYYRKAGLQGLIEHDKVFNP